MFSFSLRVSLTTLIASAVAVSATPSLSVKTSTPNFNVDGVENLKVTATIINTGNESLKLLNDPHGVLDPFPENSFIITNTARSRRPWFNGAMVNYSPNYAAGLDDPSVFTVLAPGASINITHDLSAAYNFTLSGAGNYSIEPSSLFTYVDPDGTLKVLHATIEDIAEVRFSGNLAVSRVLDRRAGEMRNCRFDQKLAIISAYVAAQGRIQNAIDFLTAMDLDNPPPRWTTWFGPLNRCKRDRVRDVFRLMREIGFPAFDYNCNQCAGYPQATSYVLALGLNFISLCPGFWALPTSGPDSKAGALIHEASHFYYTGTTGDYAYGQGPCKQLAANQLTQSGFTWDYCIWNADSYRYFAEDPPNPVANVDNPFANAGNWSAS